MTALSIWINELVPRQVSSFGTTQIIPRIHFPKATSTEHGSAPPSSLFQVFAPLSFCSYAACTPSSLGLLTESPRLRSQRGVSSQGAPKGEVPITYQNSETQPKVVSVAWGGGRCRKDVSWPGMLEVACVLGVQGKPRLHLQEKQNKKHRPETKGLVMWTLMWTLVCILPGVRSPFSGMHYRLPPVFLSFL